MIRYKSFSIGAKIMILLVVVMFILSFCIPMFIEKPAYDGISKYEQSMITSGLPPEWNRILVFSIVVSFIFASFSFFYLKKLISLRNNDQILLIQRSFKLFKSLLLLIFLLSLIQIITSIYGLSTIKHLNLVFIFDSKLLDGITCLFIDISFYLMTNK